MVGCLDAAPDYLSVPLAEAANAPVGLIPDPTRPPAGSLLLRGLPFELGPEPGRCLVHLAADGGAREAELTVGLRAHHMVFAHRLLSSRIREGDPPGRPVARITFTYEDCDQLVHTFRPLARPIWTDRRATDRSVPRLGTLVLPVGLAQPAT